MAAEVFGDGAPDDVRDRLALALDVDDVVEARRLARLLRPWFGVAKVGLELYSAAGPEALEAMVGHWDGYSQFITNNYYLHSDASGRFTMMPWGTDQAFQWAERYDGSGEHFLFNGCVQDPICHGQYVDALAFIAGRWSSWRLERRADTVYRSVTAESAGIADVKSFIAARPGEHTAWINTLPKLPTNLSVAATRGRTGSISVSWRKPASAVQITGFSLEYRLGTGAWTRVQLSRTTTSHVISGLAAGTYAVRVRSIGDGVISPSVAKSSIRVR